MNFHSRISVTLITGFLGSGKTTLLQRIVLSPEFKAGHSALLINDAGPVNIDAKIFRGKAKEVKAVTGGCICCVNPEEMKSTLLEFSLIPEIKSVWIEASGIAETDDILDRLMDYPLPQKIEIKEIIHVIDAENYPGWFFDGFGQKNQIALANRILLNKVDLVKPAILEKIKKEIHSLNPHVLLQPTTYCDADLNLHPQRLPERVFNNKDFSKNHTLWRTKWIPLSSPQTMLSLHTFLKELPKEIYRAKGFVQISDQNNETHFIQKVGPHAEIISWVYEGEVPEYGLVLLGRGESIHQIEFQI